MWYLHIALRADAGRSVPMWPVVRVVKIFYLHLAQCGAGVRQLAGYALRSDQSSLAAGHQEVFA